MTNRFVCLVPAVAAMFVQMLSAQQPCERLADLKLAHTAITSSALVGEGPLPGSNGPANSPAIVVPARCVLKGVTKPTGDSEIKFEVWLPAAGWNGKYQQVGNGGWAGAIPASAMIEPLRRGYATAGTDDGHEGGAGAAWGDAAISPISSIEYYESVRSFLEKYPNPRGDPSKPMQDFYRLFMVPGMGHCCGGVGPNNFGNGGRAVTTDPEHDIVSALERWVEKGISPDHLIGSGTVVGDSSKKMTRPLCPYPQVAVYKGAGDPNDAASFACATPVGTL